MNIACLIAEEGISILAVLEVSSPSSPTLTSKKEVKDLAYTPTIPKTHYSYEMLHLVGAIP